MNGSLVPANEWPTVFRRGSRIICKLRVRNHTGLDRSLPPLVEKRPGVTAPRGGFSVEIQLDFTPYNASGGKILGLPPPIPRTMPFDELPWKSVPRKAGTPFDFKRPAGALGPAEEFDVLEFDLGRFFDITQSGSYEVWLTFTPSDQAGKPKPADKIHDFISFMIADPLPQGK